MPRLSGYAPPTYSEEAALLRRGYRLIAGVDEVGRGPLAGPVVAGAAILPLYPDGEWVGLVRDSKRLSPRQRRAALDGLRTGCATMRTGAASAGEVDAVGIVEATRLAMARAVDALPVMPQFLLLDALLLPNVELPQRAIVKGDAKCLSIAAASIVAKLARDEMMREADGVYPGYGFGQHKGYGTKQHIANLNRLGACELHRRTFAPVRQVLGECAGE